MRHVSAVGLLVLSFAVSASAQTVRKVDAAGGGRQVQKLSVIMKSKVLIQEDQPAGQIVDVVLSDGGCVEYLVAQHDSKYYVLPYQAAEVRYADQVVFVDVAPTQFRQVQFFTQDRWPDVYATEYRQQVNTFFNVRVDGDRDNRDRPRDNNRDAAPRDRNDRNPAGAADRNARDPNRPDADRKPREGDRPRAEDRNATTSPKAGTREADRDTATPKPEPKAGERDPAPREPRTEAPRTPKPAPKDDAPVPAEKADNKKPEDLKPAAKP